MIDSLFRRTLVSLAFGAASLGASLAHAQTPVAGNGTLTAAIVPNYPPFRSDRFLIPANSCQPRVWRSIAWCIVGSCADARGGQRHAHGRYRAELSAVQIGTIPYSGELLSASRLAQHRLVHRWLMRRRPWRATARSRPLSCRTIRRSNTRTRQPMN